MDWFFFILGMCGRCSRGTSISVTNFCLMLLIISFNFTLSLSWVVSVWWCVIGGSAVAFPVISPVVIHVFPNVIICITFIIIIIIIIIIISSYHSMQKKDHFHLCQELLESGYVLQLKSQGSFLGSSLFQTAPPSATDLFSLVSLFRPDVSPDAFRMVPRAPTTTGNTFTSAKIQFHDSVQMSLYLSNTRYQLSTTTQDDIKLSQIPFAFQSTCSKYMY